MVCGANFQKTKFSVKNDISIGCDVLAVRLYNRGRLNGLCKTNKKMSTVKNIVKYFMRGDYSLETRREFDRWLIDPAMQEQKEEALKEVWEEINTYEVTVDCDAYNQFRARIRKNHTTIVLRRVARVAAMLLIPLVSVAVAFLYVRNADNSIDVQECITAYGEVRSLMLPDGSVVKLNAGTTLIYPSEFTGRQRRVCLSGEAKFDIVKNPKQPFIVATSKLDVTVLGTVFNVSAYNDNDIFATTLRQGSVEVVIAERGGDPIRLVPNEQLTYNTVTGEISKHMLDVSDDSSWENGDIVVRGASLDDIIKVAERRYGVKVYLSTDKYDDALITAEFIHNESLDDFFTVFSYMIPGLRYKTDGNKVYIY